MNETIDTILSRRTAHTFERRPVPDDVIMRALQCAVRAPNHKLSNPWRFTRVGPQTRARITELGLELKAQKSPLSAAQAAKARAQLEDPAELIVARQILDPDPHRRREDYGACACAIQNLALALWSEGVRSKWGTGAVTTDPRTYAMLEIDPAREEIIGFLWIGYADDLPETPRLSVDAVVNSVP